MKGNVAWYGEFFYSAVIYFEIRERHPLSVFHMTNPSKALNEMTYIMYGNKILGLIPFSGFDVISIALIRMFANYNDCLHGRHFAPRTLSMKDSQTFGVVGMAIAFN